MLANDYHLSFSHVFFNQHFFQKHFAIYHGDIYTPNSGKYIIFKQYLNIIN